MELDVLPLGKCGPARKTHDHPRDLIKYSEKMEIFTIKTAWFVRTDIY